MLPGKLLPPLRKWRLLPLNDLKIAIVHERLSEIAGSEHVVAELSREWPDARIHIPIVDPRVAAEFSNQVNAGSLNSIYRTLKYQTYAPLLPLVPAALRRSDFGSVDAVVISHHAMALAAVDAAGSRPTIAYVHSPARWAWDAEMRRGEADSLPGRAALEALSRVAIRTETRSAPKLTTVVANSTAVAERIRRHWNRDAVVVHPPVDTEYYTPDPSEPPGDFFLLAGRLVPYKRPDIAIRAAVAAGVKLVVAGDGREAARCKQLAGTNADITFLGRVPQDELRSLQRRAKALVMPGEEDFGIVPVEAMACGTPVIALDLGGARDSVADGATGNLVPAGDDEATVGGFAQRLADFDRSAFDTSAIRQRAELFSRAEFRRKMADVVANTVGARQAG